MEFSRREYWSGLPCPPPGDLPRTSQAECSPSEPCARVLFKGPHSLLPSAKPQSPGRDTFILGCFCFPASLFRPPAALAADLGIVYNHEAAPSGPEWGPLCLMLAMTPGLLSRRVNLNLFSKLCGLAVPTQIHCCVNARSALSQNERGR